jgi:hypothetical protein
MLDEKAPQATTVDVLNNEKTTTRSVVLADVVPTKKNLVCWEHARTLIRVSSETVDHGVKSTEKRYYVSSMDSSTLSPDQWLLLIRSHWGVENNCHHTFDAVFREDEHPWIELHPQGALVVLLLRRIAYNILTLFRSVTQRSEENRATRWRDLIRFIYNAVISTTEEATRGLRTRKITTVFDS